MRIEPQIDAGTSLVSRSERRASGGGAFAAVLARSAQPEAETNGQVHRAQRSVPDPVSTEDGGGAGSQDIIITPFGEYVRGVKSSLVLSVEGSEDEVAFKTHAPGEWMRDSGARAKFAEIYGEKALTTLDWTGTVPEHMVDEHWITWQKLDETGKPLADSSRGSRKVMS